MDAKTFASTPCYASGAMSSTHGTPSYPTIPMRPAPPDLSSIDPRTGPRKSHPGAEATKKRRPSGPLLPRRGDPGSGGLRRGLPRPFAKSPGERRQDHRVRRGAVHGGDGQDFESDPESRPAGLRSGLLAGGLLPAGGVPRLARAASRSRVADLHQLLGGGEGALRHHRDLLERREDRPLDPARTRRSSSLRTSTWAPSCRRPSAGR